MAEWLRETYPEIKILFTSGYAEEVIAHEGTLKTSMEFLPKPYSPATLLRKVRELLDNGSAHHPEAENSTPDASPLPT
jgi:two-component SAPR family response regulator